jgi:hypothetical protein
MSRNESKRIIPMTDEQTIAREVTTDCPCHEPHTLTLSRIQSEGRTDCSRWEFKVRVCSGSPGHGHGYRPHRFEAVYP